MVFIYIALNIFYILLSVNYYKSKINPISIYSFVWTTAVVLYELKLVCYYDLTFITWLFIILFQAAYNLGCLSTNANFSSRVANKKMFSNEEGRNRDERNLRWAVIVLSLIFSISVISDLVIAVKFCGLNLLKHTNQLYTARLAGNIDNGIPYLGAFIFVALIFTCWIEKKLKVLERQQNFNSVNLAIFC